MVNSALIGLTGGIGSGKSTVSKILHQLGAVIIDADAISKQLSSPKGSALPFLASAFGQEYINADGGLDREKMRTLAFNDPAAKEKLQKILHPLIRDEMMKQASEASSQGYFTIVFDIPLLVESAHWRPVFDKIVVVDCSEETQFIRIKKRNAWSADSIRNILNNQSSRKSRLSAADITLHNDEISLEQLTFQVQVLAKQIGL
jgi:dephospho-CoA kinase